jgi:ubiquinone/menaquinone biosynthesis C-methylase UbiE
MSNQVVFDNPQLIERVNQLYHDFQALEFNEVHARRHRMEKIFWEQQARPHIVAGEGSRIVDLCSGTGFVPSVLLPALPERFSVDCLDLSSKALEGVKKRMSAWQPRLSCHVGSAETLPFDDQSIACVTMNAGLHHVPNWQKCLQEVDRVLVPSGVFCLGHEPNQLYFNSNFLVKLERLIWHLFWYASPRQNARRWRKITGKQENTTYELSENLDEINAALLSEGLVDEPLSTDKLRKLVDPHTHQEDGSSKGGFDASKIVASHFPGYKVEVLYFSDYGGDMLRKLPAFRRMFDSMLTALFPGQGRLFSLVLRKPDC